MTAQRIGLARTSTFEQVAGLDAQKRDLTKAGCDLIFVEQVSSVDVVARVELEAALRHLRAGDTLVITTLSRLARSVRHLLDVMDRLETKGAALHILDMGIDTATPTGRLMVGIVGNIAAFEREIMLERQREGIAKAKAEGKYKGRKPTARAKTEEVRKLHDAGVGATEIAKRLGIGRASVYRLLEIATPA